MTDAPAELAERHLDTARLLVLNMLRQSNKELGQTVLMITHNPEAAEYGDRIIHMRDGQVVSADKDPQWAPHHPTANAGT